MTSELSQAEGDCQPMQMSETHLQTLFLLSSISLKFKYCSKMLHFKIYGILMSLLVNTG